MSAPVDNSNRARDSLARWQRDGSPDRYVPATTLCWRPRYPQVRRARREGAETVLRCGDCPGCREFEALRLARRLVETYRAIAAAKAPSPTGLCLLRISNKVLPSPRLFAVRVTCPREKHATLSRLMHRWRGVEIEPGFFRAGVESFIVLSRDPTNLVARLRRRGFKLDVGPMGKLDLLKSWRQVVIGLRVSRDAYGEDINRWYRRELARLEKLKWEVATLAVYQPFDKATDVRVNFESYGRLVPPRLWQLQDAASVDARKLIDKADSPEAVVEALRPVFERLDRMGGGRSISDARPSPEQIERNRRAYQHVARVDSEAFINAKPSDHSSPPFIGGVTELLDNSGSFEERTRRRAEAMMRAPPDDPAIVRAEAAAVEAANRARAVRSDRNSKKKLHDSFASLMKVVEEREKNEASKLEQGYHDRPDERSRR